MLINNNFRQQLPFEPSQAKKKTESTPLDFLSNQPSGSPEVSRTNSIFSDKLKPPSGYTVYNNGTLPDSSYFEDKFKDVDFSLSSGNAEMTICTEEETVGYCFPNGYEIYYEYAENSTKDNPIMNVRLEFGGTNEAWEGTMNINDIDVSNASHMEMVILSAHLTGDPIPMGGTNLGLDKPFEKVNFFDMMKKALDEAKSYGESYRDFSWLENMKEHFNHFEDFFTSREERETDSKANLEKQFQQERFLLDFRTS